MSRSSARGGGSTALLPPAAALDSATASRDGAGMPGFRFRLIDTDGSEIGIVQHDDAAVAVGDTVGLPDGTPTKIVEVYDDETGQEGDVQATLVVDCTGLPSESGRTEGKRGLLELLDRFGLDAERRASIERLLDDKG